MRALLLLPVVLLMGCPPVTNCTTEARASVTVVVTDLDGVILDDATVTYDGPDGEDLPCDEGVGTWACGYEVEGEITVHAEAPFFLNGSATVTVGADDCHVITESVTVELEPEAMPG